MNERRVRSSGRPIYGRAQPLVRPGKPKVRRWTGLGLVQRRALMLLALVGVVGYALSRMFAITNITVNAPTRPAEIKVEVEKLVDGSVRQGNLITLDRGELVSKLQQSDPSLRSVEIRRKWFHNITVAATMKQPSLGWSTGNQKYLLDRDGTAIGMFGSQSKLPMVVDGSNLPVAIGQRVVAARFVGFVAELVSLLPATGVEATSYDVTDTTLDLTVSTNKGYRIIFDTSRAASEEMRDLKAVMTMLAAQKKLPAEYIDVRIAGKAYYK